MILENLLFVTIVFIVVIVVGMLVVLSFLVTTIVSYWVNYFRDKICGKL